MFTNKKTGVELKVPYYRQQCDCDCGPASLRMVLEFHGKAVSERELVDILNTDPRRGTINENFSNVCRRFGFDCVIQEPSNIDSIKDFLQHGFPPIVNFRTLDRGIGHFAVVVGYDSTSLTLNDPSCGQNCKLPMEVFEERWISGDGHHRSWMFVLMKTGNRTRPCAH